MPTESPLLLLTKLSNLGMISFPLKISRFIHKIIVNCRDLTQISANTFRRMKNSVICIKYNLVNAEADRGFSVNRQILQDNMLERSMVAQRIVHQELTKAGGKITDVTIEKQMMTDVRLASRRRVEYLDSKSSKNRKKNRKLKERREKLRPSRNWKLRKGKLMKKLRKCCAALI